MTTPTLEKAAAVIEKLERDGYRFLEGLSGYEDSTLIAYIASAIREAENAALERAAVDMDRGVDHGRVRSSSPFWAAHLRSLKSTGTP